MSLIRIWPIRSDPENSRRHHLMLDKYAIYCTILSYGSRT